MQSFDSWYIDKKACRPLYRIHSQHKPPGTIHPPILHVGILGSLRNRFRDQINDLYYHRVPVPFWDRHPGSGPQFVVAERQAIRRTMTAKQPPSYDGKVSWFRYEELVDDWVTITTVEAPKRGQEQTHRRCLYVQGSPPK